MRTWFSLLSRRPIAVHLLVAAVMLAVMLGWWSGPAPAARAQEPNYLHAEGNNIVDSSGNRVILTGINWFGPETENYAPHGLWARNWESILDQVKELGFNTIRLPYSNQLFDASSLPAGINYDLNPDLEGLNGLEIMDKIIEGAGARNIRVILDRHRPNSQAQSELWYTAAYDEARWISDWVMLAERYAGNETVIGADLHNEPHGPATWGTGDPLTDWRLAAERAGNAILAVNPNWLIIVQGIERYGDVWYWWGGNLMGAREFPVRLDLPQQLVYSTHVYGPGVYPQPWFAEADFPDNLEAIWDEHWGYLSRDGTAPVIVGEFGGRSVGEDAEGIWQRSLVSYLREHDLSYFYWTLNPNSGDTGGLLLDDWQNVDPDKQALLSEYQFPLLGAEVPTAEPQAEAEEPSPAAAVAPGALRLQYRTANPEPQSQDSKPEFIIANAGATPVPLGSVELIYWLNDEGEQRYAFHCDWAAVGCANVLGEFDQAGDGTRFLRIHFGPGAGLLPAGEDSGEIKIRFNREDWSRFEQADDFSFSPASEYVDWERVLVQANGQPVWGSGPGGETAPSPIGTEAEDAPPTAAAVAPAPTSPQDEAPAEATVASEVIALPTDAAPATADAGEGEIAPQATDQPAAAVPEPAGMSSGQIVSVILVALLLVGLGVAIGLRLARRSG